MRKYELRLEEAALVECVCISGVYAPIGPMIIMSHSNGLLSSFNPALKPSTGSV